MIIYLKTILVIITITIILFTIARIGRNKAFKLLTPFLALCFIFCMVIFPDTSLKASIKGLNLWFNIVFPSLFPFFVASYIITQTGLSKAIGVLLEPVMRPLFKVPGCGSIALLMGITSGYPVGAKITFDLRKNDQITKSEAERLLAFTNNSGPLFIIGSVATGMLNMPASGIALLSCHIAASLTIAFLFGFCKAKESIVKKNKNKDILKRFIFELKSIAKCDTNPGKLLGDAVFESLKSVIFIGGFIIIFSVIINILLRTGIIETFSNVVYFFLEQRLNKDLIISVLCGMFEISTGSGMLCQIIDIPIMEKLIALSFIIGWAGLSVHIQVYSIISNSDISIKPYLIGKFFHGLISSAYTFMLFKYSHFDLNTRAVSNELADFKINSFFVWSNSIKSITSDFIILMFLILFSISIMIIKQHKIGKNPNK